ncbi:MAG TPA: hypothetical protein VK778_03015 [Solirubrobacteraceae bacterium]|jgi:hypothetical protein|nr:hypothetical protein [Solirubrobacteraceae bacterium]
MTRRSRAARHSSEGSQGARRVAGALCALAIALAGAGCGGGSTGTGTAAGQPRPAHASSPLLAKADAICDALNRRLADVHVANTDDHELARVAPVSAFLEEQAIRELSILTPPASLAHDWRQMMGYRRTLARELTQLGHAAKAKDEHRVQSLIASKKLVHHELEVLATHAGLVACARFA